MRSPAALATLCLLSLVACGSRVDGEQIVAASDRGEVRLSEESLAELRAGARRAAERKQARVSRVPRADPDRPTAAAPAPQTAQPRSAGAAPRPAPNAKPAAAQATVFAPDREPAEQRVCPKQLDTINVGHVGFFSGVAGPILGSAVTMMAAWAQDVNARGGLACHPVRVFTRDDGGDPSRSAALVQELVERHGVVAFVGSLVLIPTGFASAIQKAKVPAVGGGGGSDEWFESPWFFPDGASRIDQVVGLIKHGTERGKKKLGVLYCVEAPACTQAVQQIRDGAATKAGAELVYDSPVSVTQPDYTAQCLNARDAGVDQFTLGMDGASMTRVARSCAAIGYKPLISTVSGLISPSQARDQQLREFGVVTAAAHAPWTERDRPGLREYHRVLERWAPNLPPDGATVLTWAATQLFEKALANVATEARRGPVAPELVVDGLGKIRNDTLGGLTGPLSFTPGQQRATSSRCVFYQFLGTQGWTAPRGSRPVCLPR